MSQWEKLIDAILQIDPNLRFAGLVKALTIMGYTQTQARKGSSHYTFRKAKCMPITLPKSKNASMDIVYVKLVRYAVKEYLNEEDD